MKPAQKTAGDALAAGLCRTLSAVVPGMTTKQKGAFIAAYQQGLQGLASSGWLTTTQATTLGGFAAAL